MSVIAAAPASASPGSSRRLPTALAGAALSLAVAVLSWRLSPPAVLLAPAGLGGLTLAATVALGATLDEADLTGVTRAFGVVAAILAAAAVSAVGADRLEPAFGLAALGLFGFATYDLSRRTRWRIGAPLGRALALFAILAAALGLYNAYYVLMSRDLMISDFMFYRKVSIAIASLLDSGRVVSLIVDLAGSMKEDYSGRPAWRRAL